MLQEAKIKAGFTIYDYANILYGGFDNILTLIELNPSFVNLNVDLNDFVTQKLVYDDVYYSAKTLQIQLPVLAEKSTIKEIVGKAGQSLFDLCLMCYCDFDNFLKFCTDNQINSTNDHNTTFKNFKFDTNLNNNLSLFFQINKKKYSFATNVLLDESGFLLQEDGFFILQEDGFKLIF